MEFGRWLVSFKNRPSRGTLQQELQILVALLVTATSERDMSSCCRIHLTLVYTSTRGLIDFQNEPRNTGSTLSKPELVLEFAHLAWLINFSSVSGRLSVRSVRHCSWTDISVFADHACSTVS